VLTQYCSGDQIEKNDMGGACSAYGGEEKESDHWGDPGADGRIVLRWIFRKWDVGVRTGSS